MSDTTTTPTDVPNLANTKEANEDAEAKHNEAEKFPSEYVGEPKEVDTDFVYPTHLDPNRQADQSGIYLDDEQRRAAEIQRAKVEGRKPDLKNPPSTQGTPLLRTDVAARNVPGDIAEQTIPNAEKVTLSVVVGVNDENLDGNQAAKNERERNAEDAGQPLSAPRTTDGPNTEKKLAVK